MAWKPTLLAALLVGVAVAGPMMAYAGVTIVYPKSAHTVQVGGTPPITYVQGDDYAAANTAGWASAFARQDENASFTITLVALPGSNVTIDKYAHVVKTASVASFKISIATAASGTLDGAELTTLKLRLWTGGTPPTSDSSSGVCAVLDLESALETESSGGPCTGSTVYMQSQLRLGHDAAGTTTVSIRPSGVVNS